MKTKLAQLALSTLVIVALAGCGQHYSDGAQTGIVTKLSYKGLIFKSWEGELNAGGTRQKVDRKGAVSSVPNVFEFNADPSVVAKLQDALATGRTVELVYRQWAIAPWTISNDHVVIDVKP